MIGRCQLMMYRLQLKIIYLSKQSTRASARILSRTETERASETAEHEKE